jgi:Fe2+ transport protein
MTTQPHTPPMEASNEAEPDQLDVARAEGGAYARALQAMDEESGAVTQRAGDYLIAFVQENAEGMYELEDGRLVWREAPEEANAHLEIAVADAADGRFVPGLDITLTLLDGDRELFTTTMPFLWHPYLYHYGTNARVPDEGPYNVRVRIDPPTFMRHDPVNGRRYADRVDVAFENRRFEPGRKPSPDAQPRGADTGYAG